MVESYNRHSKGDGSGYVYKTVPFYAGCRYTDVKNSVYSRGADRKQSFTGNNIKNYSRYQSRLVSFGGIREISQNISTPVLRYGQGR